jgi:CO/xanthine dehydrogenase FAD-binding subunit
VGLLHRPRSTAEALELLADGRATLIAGGTDVFPALVDRPPAAAMIDLSGIAALRGIEFAADAVRIGAATRWSDISRAKLPPSCLMLQQAAREIGSIQIQNRATIGGNLCNASPAADGAPPLIALDAQVELASSRGIRLIPVEEFLVGNRRTLRAPDEIMTALLISRRLDAARSAFVKLGARKYLVISIVMVAALLDLDEAGRIRAARVAIGAASETARRLRGLEDRLGGASAREDLSRFVRDDDIASLSPIDDIRATADYRRHAAREMIGRALRQAAGGEHA